MERESIILNNRKPIFKKIKRVPIKANDFRPINDDRLDGLGYTINMEGEVRDKHGSTLQRVFLPHIEGAIISLPCNKSGTHNGRGFDTFFCKWLVEQTFYPD